MAISPNPSNNSQQIQHARRFPTNPARPQPSALSMTLLSFTTTFRPSARRRAWCISPEISQILFLNSWRISQSFPTKKKNLSWLISRSSHSKRRQLGLVTTQSIDLEFLPFSRHFPHIFQLAIHVEAHGHHRSPCRPSQPSHDPATFPNRKHRVFHRCWEHLRMLGKCLGHFGTALVMTYVTLCFLLSF